LGFNFLFAIQTAFYGDLTANEKNEAESLNPIINLRPTTKLVGRRLLFDARFLEEKHSAATATDANGHDKCASMSPRFVGFAKMSADVLIFGKTIATFFHGHNQPVDLDCP
jgi:hypothetical protein